ncbi:DUF7002 family protein [Gorillibacterium sp. sgz5001074]|uniref:DUF7002 family protein n=1 Tax=Gorillibacterium sp. sgz5001074 TaxID=3446695 RepID=UPI003F671235
MVEDIIAEITRSSGRKSLFHFTRARNLQVIAAYDALLSSGILNPGSTGARRTVPMELLLGNQRVTINPHLRIPDQMLYSGVTQEQFRACLDRHVFFWPTRRDCLKMMETYARREPAEPFAVLEFDAVSLLSEHVARAKLSKYDSGSAPRFPHTCRYRKTPDMFLPLPRFRTVTDALVPVKSSEIHEVLIEERVSHVSRHLRAVYADAEAFVPACWMERIRPYAELLGRV